MKKLSKKTITNNLYRLELIKEKLNTGSYTQMKDIKDEVKGSSILYTLLTTKNIISKNDDGTLVWSKNIPVTSTLSNTITRELRQRSKNYTIRKTSVVKKDKPILKVKTKHEIKKPIVKSKKDSSGYVYMSFLWGFFTYLRN